jgi:hypothetical protein
MYLALLSYHGRGFEVEYNQWYRWRGQQFAVMVEMFQQVSRYQPGSPFNQCQKG